MITVRVCSQAGCTGCIKRTRIYSSYVTGLVKCQIGRFSARVGKPVNPSGGRASLYIRFFLRQSRNSRDPGAFGEHKHRSAAVLPEVTAERGNKLRAGERFAPVGKKNRGV